VGRVRPGGYLRLRRIDGRAGGAAPAADAGRCVTVLPPSLDHLPRVAQARDTAVVEPVVPQRAVEAPSKAFLDRPPGFETLALKIIGRIDNPRQNGGRSRQLATRPCISVRIETSICDWRRQTAFKRRSPYCPSGQVNLRVQLLRLLFVNRPQARLWQVDAVGYLLVLREIVVGPEITEWYSCT